MHDRKIFHVSIVFLFLLTCNGCYTIVTDMKKAYPGPYLPDNEIAVVKRDQDSKIIITRIDTMDTYGSGKIAVLPGQHIIEIKYNDYMKDAYEVADFTVNLFRILSKKSLDCSDKVKFSPHRGWASMESLSSKNLTFSAETGHLYIVFGKLHRFCAESDTVNLVEEKILDVNWSSWIVDTETGEVVADSKPNQ